ncbi:MAG: hypothetical protein IK116_09400 [Firmicutes bacterium]|nr:hypothetical protein [Bacillota bacterium]
MANPLSFTYYGHRSFNEEWPPHPNVTDMWHVQGMIHELRLDQALYGFSVSLSRLTAGLEQYTLISFGVEDVLNRAHYGAERVIGPKDEEAAPLLSDEDSLIWGDGAQLLLERDAVAVRLRGDGFGLDLRLDRTLPEVWHGKDGLLRFNHRRPVGKMFNVVLPSLVAGGRLTLNDRSLRVIGRAGFDRLWGNFPLKRALGHWERMYLFFNNGDELLLTDFPHAIYHTGLWLNKRSSNKALGEYVLQAVDQLELNGWRFACGWKLHIPEYSSDAFLLIPQDKDDYRTPVARPLLGIFDEQGSVRGYAFCGLLPGARSEAKRIDARTLLGKK